MSMIAKTRYIPPPSCPECEVMGVTTTPNARVYIQLPDPAIMSPLGPPLCAKHAQQLADHVNHSGRTT